jgi:type I restriction-modification system DNA methylase subunit
MTKYTCELCKKDFNQKSDYDKHKKKKTPCITLEEIQKLTQTNEVKNDNKTNLSIIFKYCLDVLRDNEHLTGDKALRTLAHLLDLRLLEPQIGKTIDIDNYDYKFDIEDHLVENHKKKLLTIVRFSKLADEKESSIPTNMKYLWDDILSVHPKTKNIFLKGRGFEITNASTYKKLITKLNTINFESIEADILGEAYEEVISENMKGLLGQFFTPSKIKKMMVKLIDPKVNVDGSIEKIFDPAMGTGGFLITSLRHLIKQSDINNIKLDWDFIRKQGLGGREAEPDTYQLAVSNMLISSGHMFDVLEKGDSIRNPITNKYDIVMANPPFGIDGLTYDDINHALRNEYLPIKSNSAVPLFLQAIIYQLKINGRCAVVLPEGQELFSKSNALVAVREFLMKTCDLKEVIYLPAGTFTHTTIKTCVFYFIKKREGKDALETNIKVSKITQKETGREYKFSKTHQTTKVHFYDYNPDNDVKHELIEGGVSIDELSKNNYSLNYAEYLKDNVEDEVYEEGIIIKKLDEVCDINYGTRIVKSNNTEGEYPVFGSGRETFTTNTFNREGFNILIGRFALSLKCVRLVNQKLFLNDSGLSIKPKSNNILHKFIAYYLFLNEKIIYNCARGTAQKNLDMEKFKNIKIPIPSLEKQKEIVSYLDFIYEKCNKTSNDKIDELKKLNEFCLNNQRVFGENEMKTLEDICEINYGTRIVKSNNTEGEYPVFGSGRETFTTDTFNRDGFNILIGRFALSLKCARLVNQKLFLNDSGLSVKPKEKINTLLHKYIAYYFHENQTIIFNCARGTAQKNLDMDKFKKLKIPVPSLEKQKEIIEYCESNNNLIKQLENEIEQNKIQANLFLSNIVKKIKIKQDELSDDELIEHDQETNQNIINNESEEIQEEEQEEVKSKKTRTKKVSANKN